MFSTNPFVTQELGKFAWIKPNKQETIKLSSSESKTTIDLPKEFHTSNVIVHIAAAGISKSHPYYSQSLNVQVSLLLLFILRYPLIRASNLFLLFYGFFFH